jgi:hypothetical protein
MSCYSLSALPMVGALVLFLTGSASPSLGLSPAPACPPVCPPPGREPAVPAPRCPDDHEKPHTQACRCADPPRPIIKVDCPTPPPGLMPGPRNGACEPPQACRCADPPRPIIKVDCPTPPPGLMPGPRNGACEPPQACRCADPPRPIIKVDCPTPPPGLMPGPRNGACEPPPQPGPEQPRAHTMTIYNGCQVTRTTFVRQDGSWHTCKGCGAYDVFFRTCPRSPWRLYGIYCSPRRAEEVVCALRANGNLAWARRHCP